MCSSLSRGGLSNLLPCILTSAFVVGMTREPIVRVRRMCAAEASPCRSGLPKRVWADGALRDESLPDPRRARGTEAGNEPNEKTYGGLAFVLLSLRPLRMLRP